MSKPKSPVLRITFSPEINGTNQLVRVFFECDCPNPFIISLVWQDLGFYSVLQKNVAIGLKNLGVRVSTSKRASVARSLRHVVVVKRTLSLNQASEQIEETCAGVSTRDLIASQTRAKSLSGSLVNQFVKNLPFITSHRRSIGLRSGEYAGKYMGII